MYLIDTASRFKKSFKKLDQNSQKAIEKSILFLAENPQHPSLRVKKMKGYEGVFEASANMDLRMTFHFKKPDTIVLRNCGHHDHTLNNP